MPIIEPKNTDLKNLNDLHLWHAGLSTCSQRVRVALGDGKLRSEGHEEDIARLLAHADEAQAALKVCTFEFLFSGGPKLPETKFEEFLQSHQSEYLVQFHRDARAGFDRERVHEAVSKVDSDFQSLEDRLGDGRTWLTGSVFTIADIAWMPNLHRMDLMRWPLDRYHYLTKWLERASARDRYKTALEAWEPQPLFDLALPVLDERRQNGDGIEHYGTLASEIRPPQP